MHPSEEILAYWFGTSDDPETVFAEKQKTWFGGGEAVDNEIRSRFLKTIEAAVAGTLDEWKASPRSCMALVIVLDQFTRNIYRGTPQAFSGDKRALAAAKHAVDVGFDPQLKMHHRLFLRVPFEHSEDVAVQNRGVELMKALVAEGAYASTAEKYLDYQVQHRDIVARFGRFPHRNGILGRASTAEEIKFLTQPGSSF